MELAGITLTDFPEQISNVHVNGSNFLYCAHGYDHPHLNATIVTMVSSSPTIEITEPAMVNADRPGLG